MDLCVIPPIPHLRHFKQQRHLVLSHLLQYRPYREYYAERRHAGEYLILDNSAHENGIGEGPGKLLLQVQALQPQEVVVPDSLENSAQTLRFGQQAIASWYGSDYRMQAVNPRLMYVPQGEDLDDWERCLEGLMRLHDLAVELGAQEGCTIGISKDYATWEGGLQELLERTCKYAADDRYEIHLLGSGHDYWTVVDLGRTYKIRSIDTAKPFIWAMNDLQMHETGWPFPLSEFMPKRPREYFFKELRGKTLDLAHANVEVLKKLVVP